jgi:hypothetical protein
LFDVCKSSSPTNIVAKRPYGSKVGKEKLKITK